MSNILMSPKSKKGLKPQHCANKVEGIIHLELK